MAGGSCLEIMKAAFADGFDEALVSTFLKESLMGLSHLHQRGRIHLDVKVLRCRSFGLLSSLKKYNNVSFADKGPGRDLLWLGLIFEE